MRKKLMTIAREFSGKGSQGLKNNTALFSGEKSMNAVSITRTTPEVQEHYEIKLNGQIIGEVKTPNTSCRNKYYACIRVNSEPYGAGLAHGWGNTTTEAIDNAFLDGARSAQMYLECLNALRDGFYGQVK